MSFRNSFEGKQALTIDDSRAIRLFLCHALEDQGAVVTEAASGPAALERWSERGEFDLVLVDLNMPGMDGIEVLDHLRSRSDQCRRVRASSRLQDLQIILLTSLENEEFRLRGMQEGADAYETKAGFDHGDLLQRVERLIGDRVA